MKRGDVYIAAFPTADGSSPKDRPVLVVQADFDPRLPQANRWRSLSEESE